MFCLETKQYFLFGVPIKYPHHHWIGTHQGRDMAGAHGEKKNVLSSSVPVPSLTFRPLRDRKMISNTGYCNWNAWKGTVVLFKFLAYLLAHTKETWGNIENSFKQYFMDLGSKVNATNMTNHRTCTIYYSQHWVLKPWIKRPRWVYKPQPPWRTPVST